jgi:hypothetical protein
VFKSKHVTNHKLLEDVHEEFLRIPSQITGSCAIVRMSL